MRKWFFFWFLAFIGVEALLGFASVPAWVSLAFIGVCMISLFWLLVLWLVLNGQRRALQAVERTAHAGFAANVAIAGQGFATATAALQVVGTITVTAAGLERQLQNGGRLMLELPGGQVAPLDIVN